MEPIVLEGSWEEIRARDAELAGRRVRVIIVADEASNEGTTAPASQAAPSAGPTLAELLAGRTGRVSFGPPNLSENAEQAFGEIVSEKYGGEESRR
jgi:hypothetical protein